MPVYNAVNTENKLPRQVRSDSRHNYFSIYFKFGNKLNIIQKLIRDIVPTFHCSCINFMNGSNGYFHGQISLPNIGLQILVCDLEGFEVNQSGTYKHVSKKIT